MVFLGAVHFFIQTYRQFIHTSEKVEALTVRARVMEQQKAELENKKRVLSRVSSYMTKVKSLGLEKSRWTVFDVNVETPVTFATMEQILNQCTNSTSYYFKPVSLRIRTALAQDGGIPGQAEFTPASPVNEGGISDGLLIIKGAFIARNK